MKRVARAPSPARSVRVGRRVLSEPFPSKSHVGTGALARPVERSSTSAPSESSNPLYWHVKMTREISMTDSAVESLILGLFDLLPRRGGSLAKGGYSWRSPAPSHPLARCQTSV